MKCPYCKTEISDTDKYCSFCGCPTEKSVDRVEDTYDYRAEKKPVNPGKIIAIVFLCSILFVAVIVGGCFAVLKAGDVSLGSLVDKAIDSSENGPNENGKSYYDKEYYPGSSSFILGITDVSKRSYSSDMSKLEFTLPEAWEVADKDTIDKMYTKYGVTEEERNQNLCVYDFYAKNSLDGSLLYIDYFNAEYFDDDDNATIEEFNNGIKKDAKAYADENNYKIDFAEDSHITFKGKDYTQLASKMTLPDGNELYQYDFTRYEKGYFIQISISAVDLDTVGNVIGLL